VVLAMLELNAVAPHPAYVQAADEGMRYERAWFSPQQQNWPDFRRMPGQTAADPFAYGYAWCHGAPGIGMSRLQAYRLTRRDDVLAEVRAALQSCRMSEVAKATEYSFGICHGAAGNAELFLQAWEVLGDESALADAEHIARAGIEAHVRGEQPWPCGLETAGEAPGLMLGLAGIGYFYLRMHGRATVPSLLTIGNIP
jgi:lantibiotic modifying enzyme